MKFFANLIGSEEATERDPRKEVFLKLLQDSQENTCARVSFFDKVAGLACNFIKKETLAQVFSCDFCEISKNTFSYRTPPVAASKVSFIKQSFRRPSETPSLDKWTISENILIQYTFERKGM